MSPQSYQIGVLGTGFAGTITGLILNQLGYDVVMVDRSQHPRFAIGESSTPIADRILSDLCDRYDLNDIRPLTTYGTATTHRREYFVGPKRGFTYFSHTEDDPATPRAGATLPRIRVQQTDHQLLVAASQSRELGDTHWHRASVDHFLVRRARARDIPTLENVRQLSLERAGGAGWRLRGLQEGRPLNLQCDFLVDATGRGSPLASFLRLENQVAELRTASGAIYAHFQGLEATGTWFQEADSLEKHPFPCDEAAVHQVTPQGWMWQLRFDHQITSCGWGLPLHQLPTSNENLEMWWQHRLRRYPLLEAQFSQARVVAPEGGLQKIDRLQYLRPVAAGDRWAMLPSSVGFIDPLHSSGIAHAMASIEQLTRCFEGQGHLPPVHRLREYSERLTTELRWIDVLVEACYRSLHDFRVFQLVCLWYFLCVVHYERVRPLSDSSRGAFLSADDGNLQSLVRHHLSHLPTPGEGPLSGDEILRLTSAFREAMTPYNHADLLAPTVHPFYHHTAPPEKTVASIK